MVPTTTTKRTYDHRIRYAICASGEPNLFPELEVPRSTALSWIRRGCPDVVELDTAADGIAHLHERVAKLERRVAVLIGVLRVLTAMVRSATRSALHEREGTLLQGRASGSCSRARSRPGSRRSVWWRGFDGPRPRTGEDPRVGDSSWTGNADRAGPLVPQLHGPECRMYRDAAGVRVGATGFVNVRMPFQGEEEDYYRLQLDVQTKY